MLSKALRCDYSPKTLQNNDSFSEKLKKYVALDFRLCDVSQDKATIYFQQLK